MIFANSNNGEDLVPLFLKYFCRSSMHSLVGVDYENWRFMRRASSTAVPRQNAAL